MTARWPPPSGPVSPNVDGIVSGLRTAPRADLVTAFHAVDNTVTRHLCAGAYLDDDFRREALQEVYYQPRRMVAPSYGFQLTPVLWHCVRARNAATVRDLTIVGVLLLAACVSVLAVVMTAVTLLFLHLGVSMWRLMRDAVSQLRSGEPVAVNALLARSVILVFGLIAGGAVLFVLMIVGSLAMAAMVMEAPASNTDMFAAMAQGTGILLVLGVFAVPAATELWRQTQVDLLVPGHQPARPPRSPRLDQIDEQQGNTVIYSGYRPFVGAGPVIDTWGFAQRLVRPAAGVTDPRSEHEREFQTTPFTARDLLLYVRSEVAALASDPVPERRLVGLVIEDRIFLAGTETSNLSPFTDAETMAAVIRYPTTPARHYLTCRVYSWRGELVTSVHFHVAVQGRSLYLEVTTTALTPCDERYRVVDQVDGTGVRALVRALGRGIVETPRTVGMAPRNLLREVFDLLASSGRSTRTPMVRGFDYGARVSVREIGTAEVTRNHTQTQDILKYKRLIERRLLAATMDFLESQGIDTNEYYQRAQSILNVGALQTGGGTMHVGAAVGQQAGVPATPRPGSSVDR